jgi:hypothetical protein
MTMDLAQVAKDIAVAYVPPDIGRHSEIANPDTVLAILTAIEDGNYPEVAAELADVGLTTFQRWMKWGEEGLPPFDLFRRAVKRAAAKAEAVEVGKVRKAGELPQYWTASMTYLERRHPDRWSRRTEPQEANRTVINIGLSSHKIQIQATTDSHLEAANHSLLTSESES